MRYFIRTPSLLLFIIILLVCSRDISDKHHQDNNSNTTVVVNPDNPYDIMNLNFNIGNMLTDMQPDLINAIKQIVSPDSLRMYNFNEKDSSGSTDEGRKLHLFGINEHRAFIVYDRIGCFTGKRILIIFSISEQAFKPFWAGKFQDFNWQENVKNVEQILKCFKNGTICQRSMTKEYIL